MKRTLRKISIYPNDSKWTLEHTYSTTSPDNQSGTQIWTYTGSLPEVVAKLNEIVAEFMPKGGPPQPDDSLIRLMTEQPEIPGLFEP